MNDLVNRIAEGKAVLLGVEDICNRLGVSRTTFDRWVRNGNPLSGNSLAKTVSEAMANFADKSISFPPADIRIGGSPKWEIETFKAWLAKNVTAGK